MANNPLDTFIAEIDESLAENTLEPSIAKGVATQHAINVCPVEMSPEIYAALMGERPVARLHEVEIRAESALERLCAFQEVAALRGVDMASVLANLHRASLHFGVSPPELLGIDSEPCERPHFEIRCQDCGFRFRSLSSVMELAQLHANRNNHNVSMVSQFGNRAIVRRVAPEKRTWLDRLNAVCRWFYKSVWFAVWCLIFIGLNVDSLIKEAGGLRWVAVCLLGLFVFNLYHWGKDRWKKKRD